MAVFDVVVIGLGMIGSAALRALSESGETGRVAGVGPAEPDDWGRSEGPFASHYDHARITRVSDPDQIWAALARRSIDAYPALAARSGVVFHHPGGHLRLGRGADDPLLAASAAHARALGVPVELLAGAALGERFPYLRFPPGAGGLYEHGGAGWINPRALVAGQLAIAVDQGAILVRDAATSIHREGEGFLVATRGGEVLRATRVLVSVDGATGDLLEPLLGARLQLERQAHTTVLAELREEQAVTLAGMPSLIWPLVDHPVLPSVYTTPPARYPDGRWYLKIGGPLHTPHLLESSATIRAWFQSPGNPVEIAALCEVLRGLVPGVEVLRWATKPCMNTYTAHGYPYIAELGPGLFVCTGGCGAAAKSSHAIGHLGARLVARGVWEDPLPVEAFRAVFA